MRRILPRSKQLLEKVYHVCQPTTVPLHLSIRKYAVTMPSKTDDKYSDLEVREPLKGEEVQGGGKGCAPSQRSATKVRGDVRKKWAFD